MSKKSSMSFKGWNFLEWLKGNQKTFKEVLKVGLPLLAGWMATADPRWTGFVGIVGKFLLDTIEYWVKPR